MNVIKKNQVINGCKLCSKCNQSLPVENFGKTPKIKSGYNSWCRSCNSSSSKYVKKLPSNNVVDGYKLCRKCNESLPVIQFYPNPKIKSGLHTYCINCVKNCVKIDRKKKVIKPKKIRVPIPKKIFTDEQITCKKCEITKPLNDFNKRGENNYHYVCRECRSQIVKNRAKDGRYKEYRLEYNRKRKESRKSVRLIKEQKKQEELELLKIKKETIRMEKLKISEEKKEEKKMEKFRISEDKRLEKIRIREEYLNSDEYKEKKRLRSMNKFNRRMENDPIFKFKKLIRNNIRNSFGRGGFSKTSKTREILGADWDIVQKHFESLFKEGMTWDNQGEWVFDHKIPLSICKTEEEVIRLNHYTNLQPLWLEENAFKSDKILPEFEHLIDEYLGDIRDTVPPLID